MKFQITSGYGYGRGNGDYGYGRGNGDGFGFGFGFGYSYGRDDGQVSVNSGIHPIVSADDDLRVAIQTAALQPLLHLEEL